jgi:hypothetical protein
MFPSEYVYYPQSFARPQWALRSCHQICNDCFGAISTCLITIIAMCETSKPLILSTLSARVEQNSWFRVASHPESYHLWSKNCTSLRRLFMASPNPISSRDAAIALKPTLSHLKDSFAREGDKTLWDLTLDRLLHRLLNRCAVSMMS